MKQFIYADNAATTKLDIDAFEAMKPFCLMNMAMLPSHTPLRGNPSRL